jgi:hypothetical protein
MKTFVSTFAIDCKRGGSRARVQILQLIAGRFALGRAIRRQAELIFDPGRGHPTLFTNVDGGNVAPVRSFVRGVSPNSKRSSGLRYACGWLIEDSLEPSLHFSILSVRGGECTPLKPSRSELQEIKVDVSH